MLVLAKLWGVTGVLNKSTGVFTEREWTQEETARYTSGRGPQQIAFDEEYVRTRRPN